VVCGTTAVLQATKLLLAAFYVFHIAYHGLSYFCKHYLLGINSQKTLPMSVIQLCNALVNMYLSTEKSEESPSMQALDSIRIEDQVKL